MICSIVDGALPPLRSTLWESRRDSWRPGRSGAVLCFRRLDGSCGGGAARTVRRGRRDAAARRLRCRLRPACRCRGRRALAASRSAVGMLRCRPAGGSCGGVLRRCRRVAAARLSGWRAAGIPSRPGGGGGGVAPPAGRAAFGRSGGGCGAAGRLPRRARRSSVATAACGRRRLRRAGVSPTGGGGDAASARDDGGSAGAVRGHRWSGSGKAAGDGRPRGRVAVGAGASRLARARTGRGGSDVESRLANLFRGACERTVRPGPAR